MCSPYFEKCCAVDVDCCSFTFGVLRATNQPKRNLSDDKPTGACSKCDLLNGAAAKVLLFKATTCDFCSETSNLTAGCVRLGPSFLQPHFSIGPLNSGLRIQIHLVSVSVSTKKNLQTLSNVSLKLSMFVLYKCHMFVPPSHDFGRA